MESKSQNQGNIPAPSLLQSLQENFVVNNAPEASNSSSAKSPMLFIPQLNINKKQTPEEGTAEDEAKQAADTRNTILFNMIKQRNMQKDNGVEEVKFTAKQLIIPPLKMGSNGANSSRLNGGFIIPKLRNAAGEPLEESKNEQPLMAKLRNQMMKMERDVRKLAIAENDGGDGAKQDSKQTPVAVFTTPLIDLTTAIIPKKENEPPREFATKASAKQQSKPSIVQKYKRMTSQPEPQKCLLTSDMLSNWHSNVIKSVNISANESNKNNSMARSTPSAIGRYFSHVSNSSTGKRLSNLNLYDELDERNMKLFKYKDYGEPRVRRFLFNTPSPDEVVKASLQKSFRICRT